MDSQRAALQDIVSGFTDARDEIEAKIDLAYSKSRRAQMEEQAGAAAAAAQGEAAFDDRKSHQEVSPVNPERPVRLTGSTGATAAIRIADHRLKEDLEDTAGLLVDEARNALDTSTARKTANRRLGDTLDVIPEHLAVALGAALSESFSSFTASRHA